MIKKIKIIFLIFILHLTLINAAQIDSIGFINTETGAILNSQAENNISSNLEEIIKEEERNTVFPSLTSEAITALQHLASGYQLTDKEKTLMSSMFLTIDIINAFQDFLDQISDKSIEPAPLETVTSFIVWSSGRALVANKTILEMLKEDLNTAGKSKTALAKGIVQHLSQRLLHRISNKTIEEIRATNTGLAVIDRVITGKTTFLDRCYVKIVKSLTTATDWIRKIFGKKSIRESLDINIVDVLLNESAALSALDYATTLSRDVQDNFAPQIKQLESNKIETPQWTEVNSINIDNKIVPEVIDTFSITTCVSQVMINGKIETIKTYVTQRTSDLIDSSGEEKPFATITQLIQTPEGQVTQSYRITGNTANDAFETAKTITENSILKIQSEGSPLTCEVNLLEKFEIELAKTGKISPEDCTQATLEAINLQNQNSIIKMTQTVFELKPNITISGVLNLIKINALQSTPSELALTQNDIDLSITIMTKALTPNEDILVSIQNVPGEEESKIDDLIQLKKQDIVNAIFDTYNLEILVNAKGDYKFDINQLALDTITANAAIARLNNLLGKASFIERKTINKLLADIDTALANRPIEREPEEEKRYKELIDQLNLLVEEDDESKIIDWGQKLSNADYLLARDAIDIELFKYTLKSTHSLASENLTTPELIEIKKVFTDFIMGAEDFGYGSLLATTNVFPNEYKNILIKAGINSPEQQQLLLNNVAIIESKLLEKLATEYDSQTNKKAWLDNLINTNNSIAFNALSNESKINFINDLIDLSQEERDYSLANALQSVVNKATTLKELCDLQKETFAQHDILLQTLQDKIKNSLIDYYKYLLPLDQYNLKRSFLDPKDFTDYSRAFKTLSFSDQQIVANTLNISSLELMAFQKSFLAEKIFYANTFNEINALKSDIKSFNKTTPNWFTNEDIAGKHGFLTIGDAIISQVQKLIEQNINTGIAVNENRSINDKDNFKITLLAINSSNDYATEFRELPLTAQYELAQQFGIEQDAQFKEFQNSLFNDEVGVATTPAELSALQDVGTKLKIDTTVVNARLNKAIASGVSIEEPKARNIELNPDALVKEQENPGKGTGNFSEPTKNEIGQEFDSESLSEDTFYDSYQSEEEIKNKEEEYQEENIAKKTEELAEKRAAEEYSGPKEKI